MDLDTTKLAQKGAQKLTPHDNCTVLDLGAGSFPRLIELRLPGVDGARQSALWDGSLDLAINDTVIADEYAGQTIWRISDMGGGDSGAGKQRVSKVWKSDFSAVAMWANADGDIGIGTEATPHGGIGWAKLAIDGVDFDAAGPHVQFTTDADDYPVMQIFPWGHDENGIFFDSYYDGTNRSSTTDQNFQILATGGRLKFRYDSGVAAGSALTWNEGMALRTDGTVGIGTITPGAQLESVSSTGAQFRASHTTASKFLDITVNTTHDALFKTSSTGGFRFQPTTDQTDSFQILDADGGTPTFDVDLVNERVGIGTASPGYAIEVSGAASPSIVVTDTTNPCQTIMQSQDAEGFFGTITNHPWSVTTNGVRRLTIDTAGDVGIATASPAARLEVEDGGTANSVLLKVTADDGSPFGLVVGNDTFSATDTHGIRLWISDAGVGNIDAANASGQPLRINQAGGDVSIGHSGSPSTRLDIDAGAMEFAEMTAPAAGAANTTRTYAEDNAGTTRQRVKFSSGNAVTIAEDGGLQTYTITNVTTDRAYDANSTTVAELADVLGTLIADFQAAGILG
jgi:hypothetical protein